MEQIVKTIRYWLFKKTESGEHYYIRIKTDGNDNFAWSIGYKNNFGLVSLVCGELSPKLINSLENEYQFQIEKERKENLKYRIKL